MPAPINLSRFDLTSLRLLVATVEGGSLTRGAERLNMSLAAASKRMAEFESQLGTSLLERSKRGVVPTAAGQTLLRYAIEIVAELEQLSVTMADFHGSAEGHLRLWANSSAFAGFLPHLLAEYSAAFPAVMLDLQDALSEGKRCARWRAAAPSSASSAATRRRARWRQASAMSTSWC